MNPWRPTRQNWCTAEPALMLAKSSTVTWPPSVACGPKIVSLPDVAVVRDVHVRHEDVAVADLGDAAAAARAAIDRHELAEDVAPADRQPRRLALELQVLRDEADRGEREDLGFVADVGPPVDDRRRADRAVARRCARAAPIDRVRPDGRALRRRARGMHDRRRVDLRPVGHDAEQQLGFGHHLVADVRRRLRARERRAAPAERNLQPEPIARHDLAPELGVVDAAQRTRGRSGAPSSRCSSRTAATCDSASSISTAGISGVPGKVALEELFVDGDVLDGDEPAARLVLGDRVNQRGRIPVAEAVEEGVDVDQGVIT